MKLSCGGKGELALRTGRNGKNIPKRRVSVQSVDFARGHYGFVYVVGASEISLVSYKFRLTRISMVGRICDGTDF